MTLPLDPPYISPEQREVDETPKKELMLSPWIVQNIVYELIVNNFKHNPQQKDGYPFNNQYSDDKNATGIFVGIAFHYDPIAIQKRPAIFVFRDEATYQFPTINQLVEADPKESEERKLAIASMTLGVACIATNVGFVEQLAHYVARPLLQYESEIRRDFKFRRFHLTGISKPQIYQEAKDHFLVILNISTVFDDSWVIRGEDLKIKTISKTIFDSINPNVILSDQ